MRGVLHCGIALLVAAVPVVAVFQYRWWHMRQTLVREVEQHLREAAGVSAELNAAFDR